MPKSVQISEEERAFLRTSIEEKFNVKINSANDCAIVSEIIFKEVNILISYNTLRRFFKILPNSTFPSLYTVNLLSRLIGFKDFIALRAYRFNLNRDFIHENLHLLDVADEIDENILKEVFPLLNEAHWENIYQIRSLIDLFIKKGRIELISLFLKIEIDENDLEKLYKYYVAFQPIHTAAKLSNNALIGFIKDHINESKIIQQVLLQLYVEEDCLDVYYGEWINACSVYLSSDMEIFSTCIKIQFYFIKNDIERSTILLTNLNKQIKKYANKIHPILLGRIAAWNFIIKNEKTYLERYIINNADIYENISTLTFFYKLVYLYGSKKQFLKFNYITLLQTENLLYTSMSFNLKTELSMYYLMLCRYYVETDSRDLAIQTIQKIDRRYQFSCSANFFNKEYALLCKNIRQ